MQLHSHAATCPRQRLCMQQSEQPDRELAQQFQISLSTVHHWKHQDHPQDRHRIAQPDRTPFTMRYYALHALADQEEQMVLWLRCTGQLSLDDLLEAAQLDS